MSAIKFIQQVARMKAADFSKIGEGIVTMADRLNFEHIAGEIAATFQNAGLPLDKLDDFIKSKEDVIKYLNIIESSKPTVSKVSNDIIKKGSESAEVIDFKGWNPKVIEGGKEGVENLFQETKKVDWKDTPLPVNPKVESFYDELVENAYKESKKTGRDVREIIEETIDYKFTGNETGKEILDIIEKKFFKADGGRIGLYWGGSPADSHNNPSSSRGRGRQDPMGGRSDMTAAEMRSVDPAQFGGGMNIGHGSGDGGGDTPPTRGGRNFNLSPVVTYRGPYNEIENIGLRGNLGKLMAAGVINLEDAITEGNIDPTIATNLNLGNFNVSGIRSPDEEGIFASGNIGPVNVSGSYQDLGEYGTNKNIGASGMLGDLGINVNYDFESNPNVGFTYNDPGGLSGSFDYDFEGKPTGMISFSKKFKKGGRVGYDIGGLTGQAKNIYDSWIAAGHSSQDALDYLSSRGMYEAGGGGLESIVNTQQSIIPQGGGGGNERWDPNTAKTKMFNKDVWTEISPGLYDWVNTEIEGFMSPTGWKTAQGKNIQHAGLYGIRPMFSYLFDRGAPYTPGGKYKPGSIKGAWQERQDRIKLEQAAEEQQRQETARQIAAAAKAFQSTGDYDEFSGAGGNVDRGGPASRMDWSSLTDDEGDKYATGGVATMFTRRR